jgi:hypothetical protein
MILFDLTNPTVLENINNYDFWEDEEKGYWKVGDVRDYILFFSPPLVFLKRTYDQVQFEVPPNLPAFPIDKFYDGGKPPLEWFWINMEKDVAIFEPDGTSTRECPNKGDICRVLFGPELNEIHILERKSTPPFFDPSLGSEWAFECNDDEIFEFTHRGKPVMVEVDEECDIVVQEHSKRVFDLPSCGDLCSVYRVDEKVMCIAVLNPNPIKAIHKSLLKPDDAPTDDDLAYIGQVHPPDESMFIKS